jgi:dihydroflavonol-4-reductase
VRELPAQYGERFAVVTGDLQDRASLDRAVAGCGVVYHVAADYRLWSPEPGERVLPNVEGTRNLLAAARAGGGGAGSVHEHGGVHPFCRGGTGGGVAAGSGLKEMTGHYKRSKFLAERVALEFAG